MKFYESGDSSKPVIFLFPGTCCLYRVSIKTETGSPILSKTSYACRLIYGCTRAVTFALFVAIIHTFLSSIDYIILYS